MAQDLCEYPPSQAQLPLDKMATDHRSFWSLKRWLGRDDVVSPSSSVQDENQRPGVVRRLSRKVVPSLPRPGTFKRQQSELRDKLEPIKPRPEERRTVSVDRKGYTQVGDLSKHGSLQLPRTSAPMLMETTEFVDFQPEPKEKTVNAQIAEVSGLEHASENPALDSVSFIDALSTSADGFNDELLEELEKRWILNLSMHFRDRSNREKFFVTFAESPNRWRRVTISLDYRAAPNGSLEEELQNTQFQRDKSARIYESIRESLPDIQFYDTVTNLKLQTEHDRLHVHVTEDIHEVINYPSVSAISHLQCARIREDETVFDSHLSGFVYKVRVNNDIFIKKEIPGPDTVEEFLYEINALHRLSGSDSVIQFGGVIIDNEERLLKGLLISYAEKGALIDVIFDNKGDLSWQRRERWARQIVQGLSEIHEAGFVQGDFTLSNIVIDADDNAKIIDINRRGCPVGWEPPEVAALIESKQRISMYIGVKSDLFQLGMVLWAIAMEQDEPEVQQRPLTLSDASDEIPSYYCAIVAICLSDDPRNRFHATRLLGMFPETERDSFRPQYERVPTPNHMEAQYIDPATAVGRDDIDNFKVLSSRSSDAAGHPRSSATHTYVNAPTDMSGEPYYYPIRGRSPPPRSLQDTQEPPSTQSHHEQAGETVAYNEQNNEAEIIDEPINNIDAIHGTVENTNMVRNPISEVDPNVHSISEDDLIQVPVSEASLIQDPVNVASLVQHPVTEASMTQNPFNVAGPPQDPVNEADRVRDPVNEIFLIQDPVEEANVVHNAVGEAHPFQEPINDYFESLVVSVSPSTRDEHFQGFEQETVLNHMSENTIGDPEKPRHTEPAPERIPEELAGIGQHSTLEHSNFPQGLLDDDLTTETQ